MATAHTDGHGHDASHGAHSGGEHHVHPPSYYVKIWAILLVLFIISVAGPMIGIKIVTLITAFGIAIVKAYIVCAYFMHLNIERKWVIYLEIVTVALLGLFYFAVAPDVMNHEGQNWVNTAAEERVRSSGYDPKTHEELPGHHKDGAHGAAAEHGAAAGAPAGHEAPKH